MKDEMRVLIFTTSIVLFSDAVFADSRAGGDWNSGFSQGSMDGGITLFNRSPLILGQRDVAAEIMKIQNLNSKQRCELGRV